MKNFKKRFIAFSALAMLDLELLAFICLIIIFNLSFINLYKNLYKTGAVSKQVLDSAQTKYDGVKAKFKNADENIMTKEGKTVADADIKSLKAKRDQSKLNLEYTNVKALNSGTVTKKNVEKGAFVQIGQPLFAIASDVSNLSAPATLVTALPTSFTYCSGTEPVPPII